MTFTTILVDTREQTPWGFDGYPVETRRETLRTADYALPGFCEYDEENDTYIPHFGVERKSGQDFLQSITHRREQFQAEIKRASDWDSKLKVIIEEPRATFEEGLRFMKYRDVSPSQVIGTVDSWGRHYNVDFQFCSHAETAEREAFDYIITHLRTHR